MAELENTSPGALPQAKSRLNPFLIVGGVLLAGYILLALFGERLVPYGVDAQDLLGALAGPSAQHFLGTDEIGRDVFSRVIIGTRYTLFVAIVSVFFAGAMGIPLGLTAGYFGGRVDAIITTVIDLFLTIPLLILAIAIAAVAGAGMTGLIIATSITFAPPIARLIRSRVLELRAEDFVQASQALGAGDLRVLFWHVLPNTATIVFIETTLRAGQAVLVGSALGFLGLGVAPPTPEWGTLLSRGREYMEIAPHMVMAPGFAISVLVLSFNLLGDGLRDMYDPHSE